jgi:predicted phosphodiesterase
MAETIETIAQKHGLSDAEVAAVIDNIKTQEVVKKPFDHRHGTRHVKIGIAGDPHVGSKYSDYAVMDDVAKRFKRSGVDAVYLTGDMTEGYNRRKGQSFECDLHGADEQAEGVRDRFPDFKVPTFFITGDHDSWHWESAGVDIGKRIESERPDLKFLSPYQARINISKNAQIMLVHPAKGTSYAISYQIQKLIEALSGGEKPNILAVGHYHKIEYLFYRNIHAFQTGCMQRQTPWMQRMNLSAHLGAWELDVWMKKDGSIDKLVQTLYPYY